MCLEGLNYWHAMRCVPTEAAVSTDATDIHIASLERRLLASEAEVYCRCITMLDIFLIIKD